MQVTNMKEIGNIIRSKRKQQHLTQADLALWCGVGVRFISELERGKETIETGKLLTVISMLSMTIKLEDK